MQKLQHLRLGIALLHLLALYCLLVAGVAATRNPSGQWGHESSKGLLPASSMFKGVLTNVKSDHNYLVQNSKLHSAEPLRSSQVQQLSRQKEIAVKELRRRRGRRARKRRVSLKLHEVPSGPNPISNEIPTKLVHAQNTSNSMP